MIGGQTKMKGWKMYSKIHQLKEDKLNKSQVAKKLNIDYKTVTKYWDMTPEEYANYQKKTKRRTHKLDQYEPDILLLLKRHDDYKVSQILDRLWEQYPEEKEEIKYGSLRRIVTEIRDKYNILKKKTTRQYQALADPPPGYQAQVDLGTIILEDTSGANIRLYCIAIVLSKSRYKFVEWFEQPPKTADFINFHEKAFQYFKGMPREIVYDQDRLLIVNENFGDIIYTAEFEAYRQQKKFKTFICRSYDPESKGRVESVVKYAKYNFAEHRIFNNIRDFNKSCLDWLERTGNTKINGTTKKVPAEVFKKEQKHLKPVPSTKINQPKDSITRIVRKDNTILYKSNRYTVPLGTYQSDKEVYIKATNGKLIIIDKDTGEIIASHDISLKKGDLIRNNNHLRDHSLKIKKLYQKTLKIIGDNETNKTFLDMIKKEKPRYVRDQYNHIINNSKDLSQSEIFKAIKFCTNNQIWSATEYVSVSKNLSKLASMSEYTQKETNDTPTEIDEEYETQTEVRDLSEYEQYAEVNK